ncbi:MAG: hypothetical protein ACJA2M_001256 [Polaribacter sp.]|jgi:hypothetical protein
MEIAGIIISIFALSLSIFTYFKHNKKIKEQSVLLNKYHLEKIEKEKEEEKKAIIEANVITGHKGTKIIKVYNRGKSIAKNVNILIPENDGYKVFINPCPIDILPQNGIEIKLSTFLGKRPCKIEVEFEWSDDFKERNKESQTIQI